MRRYLAFLLFAAIPSIAWAKVYAVLMGDTDTTPEVVAKALERDVNAVDFALTAARARYGDDEYEIKRFVGADCTWANIRDYLREYLPNRITTDDTVFCYIGCHGSTSDYRNQRFDFSHDEGEGKAGATYRFSIFDEIERMEPKLGIFIYDCCSAFSHQDPKKTEKIRSFLERPLSVANAEVVHAAMTRGNGFVELASSSEGEFSKCTKRGSIFTMALARVLYADDDTAEEIINSDSPWREIFKKAAHDAHEASPAQRPSSRYMYDRPARTYRVCFKNKTSEPIEVELKYWSGAEFLKDEDGTKYFTIDADDIVTIEEGDEEVPIYALEYSGRRTRSGKVWNRQKFVIGAGVDYNAGPNGTLLKWHTINFVD